jgi:hypothetical protein
MRGGNNGGGGNDIRADCRTLDRGPAPAAEHGAESRVLSRHETPPTAVAQLRFVFPSSAASQAAPTALWAAEQVCGLRQGFAELVSCDDTRDGRPRARKVAMNHQRDHRSARAKPRRHRRDSGIFRHHDIAPERDLADRDV